MPILEVHDCRCENCQAAGGHPDKRVHQGMNLLLSRLDEQQRRWYVAVEANRVGHGGLRLLSQITDLDDKTISAWTTGTRARAGRAAVVLRLKKRRNDQVSLAGNGCWRNGGGPDERTKVGAEQSTPLA